MTRIHTIRYNLMLLAFAALALGQPQRTPVQHKDVPESAEHRYARQKLAEATKRCAALQAQYEDLESKIEDAVLKGTGLSRDVHPVVTTCKALEERSGRLIKAVERNNELIGEAHKQWLQHAQRMIELGAKPRPEKKTGELIPIDMLRQLSETAETHDRIVEELPTLESRLVHADDCVAIYRKTIDEKVSDLLSLP